MMTRPDAAPRLILSAIVLAALIVASGPISAESGATIWAQGFSSAAIAAAIARSQPGDTVKLPAGTFTITEAVAPKAGTRLIGAGQDNTVLRFAGDKPTVMVNIVGCKTGLELADFTIDAAGDANVQATLNAYDSRKLNIHHLTIRNTDRKCGSPAIHFSGEAPTHLHGVTDSIISDCTFENIGLDSGWGCGVRLSWGSSRNTVERCTVRNTGRGGILTDNESSDLIIRGNTVTGSGGEGLGIEVWGGCDRCVIEDNKIDHWLSIGGADWCAARRNVVSDKSGTVKFIGIEVIGSYCVVTDNLIDDGQMIGISVSNVNRKDYVYYANNTTRNCIQWAAQFQGETTGIQYNYLYKCRFDGTAVGRGKPIYPSDQGHGFRINGGMNHCVLEDCEMRGNGRLGVQMFGPNTDFLSFVRCAIVDNKGAAVSGPGDYTAMEWTDCTVNGNGSDAIPPAKPFPTAAPKADVICNASAKVGTPATFLCESDALAEPKAVALWDFGDGIPATGRRVTHIFDRPGTYQVALVVWDAAGRGLRVARTVQVRR